MAVKLFDCLHHFFGKSQLNAADVLFKLLQVGGTDDVGGNKRLPN